MSDKHVLIVDDARDILFLLTTTVKQLGPDYKVSAANDGYEALEQIRQKKFDLVITDYMMPGMTGLELAQEVRQLSPETQVLLMSAYDKGLQGQVEDMELGGYVGKPFSVPEILEVVRRVVAQTNQTSERQPATSPVLSQEVYQQLKTLYSKTGAYCVLLLTSEGHPLEVIGQVDRTKIPRLAMFVAANFLTVAELATLLDDKASVFRSIYHEGSQYNIYAHDVNGEYLLAVVFGTSGKPGSVWFYTKQTAVALPSLLDLGGETIPADSSGTTVADAFDDLLGDIVDNSK